MKRWPKIKLGAVTSKVGSGATPQGGEAVYRQSGIPLIRSMNVHFDGFRTDGLAYLDGGQASLLNNVIVRSEDVLFNITGASIGRVALAPTEMTGARVNQHVCIIRPTAEMLPGFLCYYFRSPRQQAVISGSQVGGTRQAVTKGMLLNWDVPKPPLSEQERIVKLLDEADELRNLRAQADSRTAQLIPALFHEMFSQENHWPHEKLEDLCQRVTVGHVGPMASEYVESGVPFLRGQNIKRGWLDLGSALFVSHDFHKRLEKSAITPGDVVSVRTGKPGTTAVIPPHLESANCADLIVMTCGKQLDPHYLCELLNQRLGDQENIAGATGIAQQHFNIGEARRLEIAVPPLALQKEFAKRVNEVREMEASQAASRQRTEDLFQSVLHRAFNGEL